MKTTPVEQCGSVQPRILAGGSCPVPTLRMAQFTAAFYSFASWVVVCQLTELKSGELCSGMTGNRSVVRFV